MRSFVWGEFLISKGEDNEEIKDGSELKLGVPPRHPLWISRTIKHLSLGMPKASPLVTNNHQVVSLKLRFYHFTYYVLCLEHLFAFSFVLFVCSSYACWIVALFVWERDTLHFFIWILLCFAYILLSILSYCLFASKLSLLSFIFYLI